jgi:hypothetical protein
MNLSKFRKRLKIGTVALWIILGILIIVMIALVFGEVFSSHDLWIPPIPIGVLLILAIAATVLDLKSESNIKMGLIGLWTLFSITFVVFAALIFGNIFEPSEYWIPMIPVGTLLVLALIPTLLEYASGGIRFCPKCGKRLQKKWEFCQECGSKILVTCPSCGKKIKGNPKYCHKCGVNLAHVKIVQTFRKQSKYKAEGQIKICNNCNTPIDTEAKFCVLCGANQ